MKPLILAEELQFPHVLSVIDTRDEWFYSIHPERYVPSLKDEDPATKEKVIVFESTACLQYLTDRFDTDGFWTGRTAAEKGAILSWTAYQTAALGYAPITTAIIISIIPTTNNVAVPRPSTGFTSRKDIPPGLIQLNSPVQLRSESA